VALGAEEGTAAPAAEAETPEPAEYIGAEMCMGCHEDLGKIWQRLPHSRFLLRRQMAKEQQGCEACHGPGSKHVMDEEFKQIQLTSKSPMEQITRSCLRCHQNRVKNAEWQASEHARHRLSCVSCHPVHHPKAPLETSTTPQPALCLTCHPDQRAGFTQNSHHPVLEGRLKCSECHDPHRAERRTHARPAVKTDDDLCLTCHLEKRGPFVYEHDVATGTATDECLSCHQGHGSPHPKLQKMFGRGLCLQCHTDIATDTAHRPRGGNCWRSGCHSRLHGSNRSRLFFN